MAEAVPESCSVSSEIESLKERFGLDCRVIDNIGDFVHVVSISFKQWDIKIKFQISGIYFFV